MNEFFRRSVELRQIEVTILPTDERNNIIKRKMIANHEKPSQRSQFVKHIEVTYFKIN